MSRFEIQDLPLAGLKLVQPQPQGDARGSLTRLFCAEELRSIWPKPVVQINLTRSRQRGTVRGLHFQHPPHAEAKLVTCLRGEVWDVVVDLRAGSPTLLQWHAETLSGANRRGIIIPEGFAHGFQTQSDEVEMLYFHSAGYLPAAEDGLSPQDPRLDIPWPAPIALISERDRSHPQLDQNFKGLAL